MKNSEWCLRNLVRPTLMIAAGLGVAAGADQEAMNSRCQVRAAGALKVDARQIQVKYEGQRTDKTHAVNGSANVNGQERTFQCSFAANGIRIVRFVLNPASRPSVATAAESREDNSALRAGEGQFDARGQVPCAQGKGAPMGQCAFGVARAGGGSATVAITRPDGRKRMIFFTKGKAIGADISQADGKVSFRSAKEADLYMITIGLERYEIPEAVVFGG